MLSGSQSWEERTTFKMLPAQVPGKFFIGSAWDTPTSEPITLAGEASDWLGSSFPSPPRRSLPSTGTESTCGLFPRGKSGRCCQMKGRGCQRVMTGSGLGPLASAREATAPDTQDPVALLLLHPRQEWGSLCVCFRGPQPAQKQPEPGWRNAGALLNNFSSPVASV